jgi:site-specific recombinase XerD
MKARWVGFQSALADAITQFLCHQRALGKRFHSEEDSLRLFDRYLVEQKVGRMAEITPALVEAFLSSRPRKHPRSFNHLLGVVRRLFDWLVRQERLPSSPVHTRARQASGVRVPFLFNPAQARKLLEVAAQLPDNNRAPRRGCIYAMIFALLYGLGLRVGEAARLCRKDLDLDRNVLTVRQTKFGKSRFVPFGPKLAGRLRNYLQGQEAREGSLSSDAPLFSFKPHKAIHPDSVSQTFHHLWPRLNLSLPAGMNPPRLHCLRHSFAVGTLLRWYRAGVDPRQRLLDLATFMGHVNPTSTAVYLTITAELLREADRRFERFAAPVRKQVSP